MMWELRCGVRELEPVDGWARWESDGTATLTIEGQTRAVADLARNLVGDDADPSPT